MPERHVVARTSDLADGQMRRFQAGVRTVLLARVGGVFYAVEDVCTHMGPPLSDGTLNGHVLECRHHGGRFDIRTGDVLTPPPGFAVPSYAVEVVGDEVVVLLPGPGERW